MALVTKEKIQVTSANPHFPICFLQNDVAEQILLCVVAGSPEFLQLWLMYFQKWGPKKR